jgi:hypothetical protein
MNTKCCFEVGMVVSAKSDPGRKLLIMDHYKSIYYCAVIGDAAKRNLRFFEKELMPPAY